MKVLSESLASNPTFLHVLRIHMESAAIADHPGMAAIYQIAEANGFQYFTYESTPRGSLSQQIASSRKLSVFEALDITIRCAETLQAAAQLKIFHGNLRLNSILLLPDGSIKIAEFGFAAAVRALFESAGLPAYLGAARFLAPEMTKGGSIDCRTDIYSLGLILYFLLFNDLPFRYEGERLPVPVENTEVENVEEFLTVLSKMTEVNPAQRYQEYDSLIQDLRFLFDQTAPPVRVPVLKRSSEGVKTQRLFKLMCVLFASRSDGTLIVADGNVRRNFFIRDRKIIYFESNQSEENIWNWLVEKKEIQPESIAAKRQSFEARLNGLIAKKAIRFEEFRYSYQELANRTLTEALKEPYMEATFISGQVEGEPLCLIPLSELVLRAARYRVELDDILDEIKPNQFWDRTPLFESLVSELPLNEIESMLLSISQQGIATGNLNVRAGSSAEKGVRFIYLLKEMGALKVRSGDGTKQSELAAIGSVIQTPPNGVKIEGSTDERRGEQWLRMQLQKSAGQAQPHRLDRQAEQRFEKARECFKNEKFWEAANLCEQALNLHEDARYYWLMGLSYAQHPRFRHKAEDSFHRAIVLNPINDDLHADLADFYLAQGLLLRARSHALLALQIVPDQTRARKILATPGFEKLGHGGCCCEHDPVCHHLEHRAWRLPIKNQK